MNETSPANKLKEGLSWSTLVSIVGRITSAISYFILIIILDITDYGLYSFATASFVMFATILEIGITTGLVKTGSEHIEEPSCFNKLVSSISLLNQLYTIPSIIAISSIAISLSLLFPTISSLAESIVLISISLAPYGLFSILNSGLRSIQSFKSASITIILADAVTNILALLFAVIGFGYRGAIIARFFSYTIATFIAYRQLSVQTGFRFSKSIDFDFCRHTISTGLPALGITVANSARNWFLVSMIVALISVPALGIFSALLFLLQLPWFLWSDGLRIYLLPVVSTLDSKGMTKTNVSIFKLGLTGTIMIGGAMCAALVSSGYDFASSVLSIVLPEYWILGGLMMFSLLFTSISTFCTNILWGVGKQNLLLKRIVILSSILVVPQWLLVSFFGLEGAGIYMLVYSLILAVVLTLSITTLFEVSIDKTQIFGIFLSIAVTSIVCRVLLSFLVNFNGSLLISSAIVTFLAIGFYFALLIGSGLLEISTLKYLFNLILSRRTKD